MSSDDDTNSTMVLDGEYDSEHHSDADMHMEDDADAPDEVDLDGNMDMERDTDNEEEEAEEKEGDEEQQDEDENEDEHEDEDEEDGKEPQTIGHREMVNTSADNVDTMVGAQPTVLLEQSQEMREQTPCPQHLAPAPRPQTPEVCWWPWTPVTHPPSGLEFLRRVMPHKPCPAAPTRRGAEAAGDTSDVDVDQQLLGESAGGDSLPIFPLPHVALPNVPFPETCADV